MSSNRNQLVSLELVGWASRVVGAGAGQAGEGAFPGYRDRTRWHPPSRNGRCSVDITGLILNEDTTEVVHEGMTKWPLSNLGRVDVETTSFVAIEVVHEGSITKSPLSKRSFGKVGVQPT